VENDWASGTKRESASQSTRRPPPTLPETPPILIVHKDHFATVAAIHHMINRPRVFHAQLASHILFRLSPATKSARTTLLGTDHFTTSEKLNQAIES
jgi:hypothetical protein